MIFAAPYALPTMPPRDDAKIVSTSWGVSLALVMTILGGVAAQMSFVASIRERAATLEAVMAAQTASLARVEASVAAIAGEMRDLRIENSQMRERLSKVESALERR